MSQQQRDSSSVTQPEYLRRYLDGFDKCQICNGILQSKLFDCHHLGCQSCFNNKMVTECQKCVAYNANEDRDKIVIPEPANSSATVAALNNDRIDPAQDKQDDQEESQEIAEEPNAEISSSTLLANIADAKTDLKRSLENMNKLEERLAGYEEDISRREEMAYQKGIDDMNDFLTSKWDDMCTTILERCNIWKKEMIETFDDQIRLHKLETTKRFQELEISFKCQLQEQKDKMKEMEKQIEVNTTSAKSGSNPLQMEWDSETQMQDDNFEQILIEMKEREREKKENEWIFKMDKMTDTKQKNLARDRSPSLLYPEPKKLKIDPPLLFSSQFTTRSPTKSKSIVKVCTSKISRDEILKVQDLCTLCIIEYSPMIDPKTTHIVTSITNGELTATPKIVFGIAHKMWILNFNWVKESLRLKAISPEEEYEVCNEALIQPGPKLSRLSESMLFENIKFFIPLKLKRLEVPLPYVTEILSSLGGTVLENLPTTHERVLVIGDPLDFSINFRDYYDERGWLSVSWDWIVESIMEYRLVPCRDEHILTAGIKDVTFNRYIVYLNKK